MFNFKKWIEVIFLLILFLATLSLILFIYRSNSAKEYSIEKASLAIDGKYINFKSKKPILIIFFSVDCRICYQQILNVNKSYYKIIHKIRIFGVTRDDMESIKNFKVKYDIKFPLIYDKFGKYHKKFSVKVIPHRILIKENRIIYKDDHYKNFSERDKEFNEALRTLL